MFTDRREAGEKLLRRLPDLDPEESLVVALPRGGLPVADVIAEALSLPLDLALVRKVGLPGQPEFAIAAVTDGEDPKITVNENVARMTGYGEDDIRKLAERELPELRRRRDLYLGGRAPLPLAGKTVLVVDDGIATGATMRAALRLIRAERPKRIVVAVPVAPSDTLTEIERDCDDVICLECPADFRAVGLHYRDFGQVSDATVAAIMDRHAKDRESSTDRPDPPV